MLVLFKVPNVLDFANKNGIEELLFVSWCADTVLILDTQNMLPICFELLPKRFALYFTVFTHATTSDEFIRDILSQCMLNQKRFQLWRWQIQLWLSCEYLGIVLYQFTLTPATAQIQLSKHIDAHAPDLECELHDSEFPLLVFHAVHEKSVFWTACSLVKNIP